MGYRFIHHPPVVPFVVLLSSELIIYLFVLLTMLIIRSVLQHYYISLHPLSCVIMYIHGNTLMRYYFHSLGIHPPPRTQTTNQRTTSERLTKRSPADIQSDSIDRRPQSSPMPYTQYSTHIFQTRFHLSFASVVFCSLHVRLQQQQPQQAVFSPQQRIVEMVMDVQYNSLVLN